MANAARFLGRRAFLSSLSATIGGLAVSGTRLAAKGNEGKEEGAGKSGARRSPRVKTFTYKAVGNLEIKADVFRPDDDVRRPVLLWIHGGALIMGNRAGITRQIKNPFLKAGYAIVSIDYRLAPETKLPQIIDDLRDAYTWLHDQGPRLFNVDTSRIAVAGGSAGGYLTLMTGFCVRPTPACLVSLWGYGDLVGDWYIKPSEFYRKQPLVTKEEAWKGVSGPPLSDDTNSRARRHFYLYCRQQGLWTKEVSGFDPAMQDSALTPYCPVRNVIKGHYPPTLFIHGTRDTDVPYEQSVQMDHALASQGIEHKLISIPNAGHGIGDGDPQQVAAAYAAALAFVNEHLKTDKTN